MELLHTMIRVKDIEKSLNFYKELLEMEVVREKKFDDSTLYFLTDKNRIAQIELTHNDNSPESGYEIGTGFGHFGFKVESMDEFSKKIAQLGVQLFS